MGWKANVLEAKSRVEQFSTVGDGSLKEIE